MDGKGEFPGTDRDRVQGGWSKRGGIGSVDVVLGRPLHPEAPLLKRADLDRVGYKHGAVFVVSQV